MKKTYIAPTMLVVPVKMNAHILLQASLITNTDLVFGGEVPTDFDSDDIR